MDKWFFDNKKIQVFQKHFYCILFFSKGLMAPKTLEITFELTKNLFFIGRLSIGDFMAIVII